jgi:hypothetical protein
MKKHSFLIFTYLFLLIVLLPAGSSANSMFTIAAVKAGSGTPGIPIDTIHPGIDFGIRIAGAPNIPFELLTSKLDEPSGAWINDSANVIYPIGSLTTDAGGLFTVDDAFYRFAWSGSSYMCPFKDVWVRIVVKAGGAPVDSSKPLLALAGPIDSARYLIVANPNPMGATGPAEISIYGAKGGGNRQFQIKIFDTFGYLVRDLLPDVQNINQQRYMFVKWDGTNTSKKKVANGVYLICVKVMEDGKEAGIWKKKIGVAW